ncbi:hypothetical protein GCM10009547_46200 [Sporichthya brevicatena]|uniref:Uncharacterized protein n=1 Tax=Sporichthya brevicatena TaxID=171442 RepID=A0ABP3SH28_9ACTN
MATTTAGTAGIEEQLGALRLQLDRHRSTLRSVDGAWWPHSRDVIAEVTQLVMGAEHLVGRIDRVALHASEWADHPRRILLGGRVLHLGFFTSGASRVNLVRRDGDDIVLLVIPPTATTSEGASATARAVDSDDRSQPAELLAGAGTASSP